MIWSFYERNRSSSQTHRFGAFVRHAQRSKKVLFFIREDGFDTLRWIEPFSVVLQISWPAAFFAAAARLLWKIEKAYSLGIPKKNLAHGESQTEEEYAYGEKYTMFQPNGRSFWT